MNEKLIEMTRRKTATTFSHLAEEESK